MSSKHWASTLFRLSLRKGNSCARENPFWGAKLGVSGDSVTDLPFCSFSLPPDNTPLGSMPVGVSPFSVSTLSLSSLKHGDAHAHIIYSSTYDFLEDIFEQFFFYYCVLVQSIKKKSLFLPLGGSGIRWNHNIDIKLMNLLAKCAVFGHIKQRCCSINIHLKLCLQPPKQAQYLLSIDFRFGLQLSSTTLPG